MGDFEGSEEKTREIEPVIGKSAGQSTVTDRSDALIATALKLFVQSAAAHQGQTGNVQQNDQDTSEPLCEKLLRSNVIT